MWMQEKNDEPSVHANNRYFKSAELKSMIFTKYFCPYRPIPNRSMAAKECYQQLIETEIFVSALYVDTNIPCTYMSGNSKET